MDNNKFINEGAFPEHPKWQELIRRQENIYIRDDDIRTEFSRDYNRILHSTAYRRLKHKTQVFFATANDHICTRIEHVNHVASVSYTISKYLGLNTELTNAIAIGHDLGHAPFGHQGEIVLKELVEEQLNERFWHEKNSLYFIDKLETLPDPEGRQKHLNLTYAVRDGIILHCGEVDENAITPRDNYIDLESVEKAGQYSPLTWEGCVVKISDKISYLGRDIEDALTQKFLVKSQIRELKNILKSTIKVDLGIKEINNTVLIHKFIINLCQESAPNKGLCFSKDFYDLITLTKKFNYENIYAHKRLDNFKKYVQLVIRCIFDTLQGLYNGENTINKLGIFKDIYPLLIKTFTEWLIKYANTGSKERRNLRLENKIIYNLENENDYTRAIINYISGMTDNFAIKVFQELTSF